MQFLRTLLGNSVIALLCAILIQTAGAPVAELITWGAAQVTSVVEQVDVSQVEAVTEPVQLIVEQTVDWVTQLGSSE